MKTAAPRREETVFSNLPPTVAWNGGADGWLELLDQTLLPEIITIRTCRTAEEVWEAIRVLCVRGAPAIGVAAAYGLCVGTMRHRGGSLDGFQKEVRRVADYLNSSRPTAVNLSWAVNRVAGVAVRSSGNSSARVWDEMLADAHAIRNDDVAACRKIGEFGARLIPDGGGVLTHCNAGALATVAFGTATAPMYVAHAAGRRFSVFADETRPLMQGARLTAFELAAAGIDVSVLCDNAAPSLMRLGKIKLAIVGADRIAANGDTANKIGTYGVALAARAHEIPFYVAAPKSTFDLSLPTGAGIPIEQRSEQEVRGGMGKDLVAPGVRCLNPAFDVTPAELITGIITEFGIITPVTTERVRAVLGG